MESLHLRIADHNLEPKVSRETSRSWAMRPWWQRLGSKRARLTVESVFLGLAVVFAITWFSAPYFARDYINRGLSGLPDYTGRVKFLSVSFIHLAGIFPCNGHKFSTALSGRPSRYLIPKSILFPVPPPKKASFSSASYGSMPSSSLFPGGLIKSEFIMAISVTGIFMPIRRSIWN